MVIHARVYRGAVFAVAFAALFGGGCPDYMPFGSCDDSTQCDDKNPCTNDVCGPNSICEHPAIGDGPAAVQVKGDCSTKICRAGSPFDIADDKDVNDDDESCTFDACSNGKPVNTAVLGGTPCSLDPEKKDGTPEAGAESEAGANAAGDAGAPVAKGTCVKGACVGACKADPNVCDDGSECTDEHCDDKADRCVFTYRDAVPTPNSSDQKANCRARRCVAGYDLEVIDDTDLPKAPSDCVKVSCNEGSPNQTTLDFGTKCKTKGGTMCDAAGACVECNSPEDCDKLPKDDACQTRTCTNGKCGQKFATSFNEVPGTQVAGDCKKTVCDGHGKQTTVADTNDIPDDFNECTNDSCQGETPKNEPKDDGSFCAFGLKCTAGKCEGCKSSTDCIGFDDDCKAHTCENSQCTFTFSPKDTMVSLQANGDCQKVVCDGAGHRMTETDDMDLPSDGQDCTNDLCSNGVKSNTFMARGSDCSNGHCDGKAECMECNDPKDCPDPPSCVLATCEKNKCGTANVGGGQLAPAGDQTEKDCKTVVCDGQGGEQTKPSNDIPDDGKECTIDTCDGPNPRATPYPAGTPCPKTPNKTCDGKGNCR